MYKDEFEGLYDINELRNIGFSGNVSWKEQKLLMELRRDVFDSLLTLYAIDNAEPFNKSLDKVSIKEFLEAVQKNYEDEQFTYIMKNRLEAAVSFYLGREVYYEEDFFNSPSSSDPDMVYQVIANTIFQTTEKIVFAKDKYKFSSDGTRNSTETILQDLTEDLGALEFCENVILEDIKNMLSTNCHVDNNDEIPSYFKHKYKYNPKDISIYITNSEFINSKYEETNKYYRKIQKKVMRRAKRKQNLDSFTKFFVKTKPENNNVETDNFEK